MVSAINNQSDLLLEGERPFLHLLEAYDCRVESLLFLLGKSHLYQPFLLNFPHHFHPFYLQLLLIVISCHILPLIFIVIPSKFKDPIRVNLTHVMDVVGRAFDDLMVDNPLRIDNASD